MPDFVRRIVLDAPPERVFRWHARPGAFERLVPPWTRVEVVERTGTIHDGDRLVMRMRLGPMSVRWAAVHHGYEEGRQFCDTEAEGPFRSWVHTHRFLPHDGGSVLEDAIAYELPGGTLGARLGAGAAARMLERTFRFRHARTAEDLARHAAVADRGRLRVVVSGATGLIGRDLVAFLTTGGHRVDRLLRRHPAPDGTDVRWDPARGEIDAGGLEGADAVVHLAGESIAAGHWTVAQKAAIRDSRVRGTRLLAETLAGLAHPPRVFVSASAIGWYGNRGDETVTEASDSGGGFLAEVCRAWEDAAEPARRAEIRVVHPRIGVVLTPAGGALAKMLPAFRMGGGGRVGTGRQVVSWIGLDDVVYGLHHLLYADDVAGPVNLVAPGPVTNAELARTLAAVLGRPAAIPLPETAVRLLFGEMGQALLLDGAHVEPRRLAAAGFRWMHPSLGDALAFALGRAAG